MRRAHFLTATVIATGVLAAQPALAQDQPAAQSQQSLSTDTVQDIVVTAQRRSEKLQDVPISATALSGDGLAAKAVTRLSDLQFAAPSLSISEGGLVQSTNIRGIGLASGSPSVANGVATYVDGLFQPPIVQTGAFYDIADVEVLRGPQGTIVGSNSTGGAIFINTQSPTLDRVGGYLQGSYGNYESTQFQGAINIPLSNTLAIRAATSFRNRDSYYTDVGPFHNDAGRLNEKAGRFGLLWNPGAFKATIKAEFFNQETGGFAYRPIPGTANAAGAVGDIFTLSYNTPTAQQQHAFITSAELRYELSNGITLRSVTGYQNKFADMLIDNDATQIADIHTDQFVRERQTSQEINIISPTTGALNWILGGYYQRNVIDVRLHQLNAGFPLDVNQRQAKVTTGVFAQINYKLTDTLEIQMGGRYSHFEASGSGAVAIGNGIPGFPTGGLVVADLAGGNKDGRATGKLALNWKVNPNNLLYVFAARGYKPGGYNSATSFFKPETVMNYEAGWKGTLVDGHVHTQFDVFYNDYHGFQFGIQDTTTGQNGVTNLPTATIWGLEGQVQVKFGGFSLDAAGSYVHSKLPSFTAVNTSLLPPGNLGPQCPAGTPSSPPTCFDYTPFAGVAGGGPNLLSPEWTYNIGAQYSFALGNKTTLTPRINYAYVGTQYANIFYSPITDQLKAHGLLSALVTLQLKSSKLEFYGTNLTNTKYVLGQNGTNEFFGAPREYGVRLGIDF